MKLTKKWKKMLTYVDKLVTIYEQLWQKVSLYFFKHLSRKCFWFCCSRMLPVDSVFRIVNYISWYSKVSRNDPGYLWLHSLINSSYWKQMNKGFRLFCNTLSLLECFYLCCYMMIDWFIDDWFIDDWYCLIFMLNDLNKEIRIDSELLFIDKHLKNDV